MICAIIIFGMMASCQNIEDFYRGAAENFERLLKSQDIGGDEIGTLVSKSLSLTPDKNIADLLNIELLSDYEGMIAPVSGAVMTNPEVIRTQISEFMKYRAPLELLVDNALLTKLEDSEKQLEDAEKNQPLEVARTEHLNDESVMLDGAHEILVDFREYQTSPPGAATYDAAGELNALKNEKAQYQKVYDWVQESRKKQEELKALEKAAQEAEKALADILRNPPSFGSGGSDDEDGAAAAAYAAAVAAAQAAATAAREAYNRADAAYKKWRAETDRAIAAMNSAVMYTINTTGQLSSRLDGIPAKLNELYNAAGAFDSSFTVWDETAQKTDTDFGKQNKDEVKDDRNIKAADNINEESVDALRQRVYNAQNLLNTMCDEARSLRYGGVPVTSIVSLQDAENVTYGGYDFSSSYSAAIGSMAVDSTNNPNIDNSRPALYQWMNAQKFADIDESKCKEAKKGYNAIKKAGDKEAGKENQTKVDESRIPLSNMTDLVKGDYPSNFDHSNDGLLVAVKDLLTNIIKLTKPADLIRDSRDALFATAYVKGMFSWYTYENEGKYTLLSDEDKKNIKPSTVVEVYKKYDGGPSDRHKWQSTDTRDFYNKTLTNYMISSQNNYLYGGEVEYILYGKDNKTNIETALTIIWAIRYALNVPSAFASFWIGDNETAVTIEILADAIALATGGIIPAPLSKTVFILALTVFETIHDMEMLKAGMPVKFIKDINDDEWFAKLEQTGEYSGKLAEGGKSASNISGPHFTYGDYLSFFLILSFSGDQLSKGLYLRTADLMQANIRTAIGGIGTDYKLSRALTYFKLDAQVRAKPLMLALPIAAEYTNGQLRVKDWCTFDYSAVRGYT